MTLHELIVEQPFLCVVTTSCLVIGLGLLLAARANHWEAPAKVELPDAPKTSDFADARASLQGLTRHNDAVAKEVHGLTELLEAKLTGDEWTLRYLAVHSNIQKAKAAYEAARMQHNRDFPKFALPPYGEFVA